MVEVTANSQFHDPQLRCMVVTVSPADERFLLDQTLESMAAGRPLDETLRHLVHIAEADTLGADATILYDLDAGNSPSRQSTHTNGLADLLAGRRPESGADPWTRVLAGAGPRIWDIDRLPTALAQAADAARYTSCWVWPAVIDDGRQGTVVAWRTDERFEREETRVVMDRLARVAGLVIDKGRSDDLISWAANHDPLTGLANRARFYSELESALSPENEAPQAAPGNIVGVIAIDLDDFKPINDQHGHGAGDEVLRLISQRIVSSVGENGLSARIGGDEFVVVLAGVDDDASLEQIGIDLLASLNQPLDWSHGPPISVAASIGVAGCVPGVCSSDLLVEAADTALYAAKAEGNTVVRAGDAAGASQSRVTRRAIARDPQSPRAERT
jgi:diguanylate cyclase (GGDEF)-like protein